MGSWCVSGHLLVGESGEGHESQVKSVNKGINRQMPRVDPVGRGLRMAGRQGCGRMAGASAVRHGLSLEIRLWGDHRLYLQNRTRRRIENSDAFGVQAVI